MTSEKIIEEIKLLPPDEQTAVIRFALTLAGERQLTGAELNQLARRMVGDMPEEPDLAAGPPRDSSSRGQLSRTSSSSPEGETSSMWSGTVPRAWVEQLRHGS